MGNKRATDGTESSQIRRTNRSPRKITGPKSPTRRAPPNSCRGLDQTLRSQVRILSGALRPGVTKPHHCAEWRVFGNFRRLAERSSGLIRCANDYLRTTIANTLQQLKPFAGYGERELSLGALRPPKSALHRERYRLRLYCTGVYCWFPQSEQLDYALHDQQDPDPTGEPKPSTLELLLNQALNRFTASGVLYGAKV